MSHGWSRHRAPTIHIGSNKETCRSESVPRASPTTAAHRIGSPPPLIEPIILPPNPLRSLFVDVRAQLQLADPIIRPPNPIQWLFLGVRCQYRRLCAITDMRSSPLHRKSTNLRACVVCQTNSFSYWDSAKLLIFWTVGRYWGSHDNRHDRISGGNELVLILTGSYKVFLISKKLQSNILMLSPVMYRGP